MACLVARWVAAAAYFLNSWALWKISEACKLPHSQ